MTQRFQRLLWQCAIPLLLLAVLSIWFRCTDADFALIRGLRSATGTATWDEGGMGIWGYIKDYGVLPSFVLVLAAIVGICGGLISARLAHWIRPCAYVILVYAIGGGLISNLILKEYWGRPRPKHVIEFGGEDAFVKVLTPAFGEVGKSFPCGHATTGFCFFAVALLLQNRRPGLAKGFTAFAATLGGLIGVARVLQGGHFPSDVVWAAGVMWFTGLGLLHAMRLQNFREAPCTAVSRISPRTTSVLGAAVLLLLATAVLSFPLSRQQEISLKPPTQGAPQSFQIDFNGSLRIVAGDEPQLRVAFDGCGTPKAKLELKAIETAAGVTIVEVTRGFLTEKNTRATLRLVPGSYQIKCSPAVKSDIARELGKPGPAAGLWLVEIPAS